MAHGPWPTAHGDPAAIRRARGDDTGEEETREGAGGGLSQASRRSWSRPAHQLTYPTKPWERQPRQMVQPSADRYRPNRSASLRSFAGTTLSERVAKSLSSKRKKDTETPKRYLSVPGFSASPVPCAGRASYPRVIRPRPRYRFRGSGREIGTFPIWDAIMGEIFPRHCRWHLVTTPARPRPDGQRRTD